MNKHAETSLETEAADLTKVLSRNHIVYMAIAYGLSWILWITAFVVARNLETDILHNEEFVWRFFSRDTSGTTLLVSIISLIAVYGPLLGTVVMSKLDQIFSGIAVGSRHYLHVMAILLVTTVPVFLSSFLVAGRSEKGPVGIQIVALLLAFFVIQMFTSCVEEIGWQVFLSKKTALSRDYWRVGLAVGPIWAAWHIPILVMLFTSQGMQFAQTVGPVAGFGIGIVAMAILHAWFIERTGNVVLKIFVHPLYNTVPLTITLLFMGLPIAFISSLLLWGVVIFLRLREDTRSKESTTKHNMSLTP